MNGLDQENAWMEHILNLLNALGNGGGSLSEQERQKP